MKNIWNIIRYLLFFLLNIFILNFLHSYLSFIIVLLLILFPIYSIYGLKKIKNAVKFDLVIPNGSIEKNQEAVFQIHVFNPTFFPLLSTSLHLKIENCFYQFQGEHDLIIPLRMKNNIEVVCPIRMEYCGHIEIFLQYIILKDLFGLYEEKLPINLHKECVILPNGNMTLNQVTEIYQNGMVEVNEGKEKGLDFSDVSEIREYIIGDKLQNIHWKLSAKKDTLMVKERQNLSSKQFVLLVDLVNDMNMCLESILELLDAITKALVQRNLPLHVYYYSENQNQIQEVYVNNIKAQENLLHLILHDKCYTEHGKIEQIFSNEFVDSKTYLYIGAIEQDSKNHNVIVGDEQISAILREG